MVAALIVALSSLVASASATAREAHAHPSIGELRADLSATLSNSRPVDLSATVPPLLEAGSLHSFLGLGHGACYHIGRDASVPANPATSCAFGDIASHRIIVLTGDSQAWMWLASFDALGRTAHMRVVFLAKPGCAPWGNPNPASTVIFSNMTAKDCADFIARVHGVIKALHPADVIPVGRSYPLQSGAPQSAASFRTEVAHLTAALRPLTPHVVYLTPFPRYDNATSQSPFACLAIHARSPLVCSFAPSKVINATERAGLVATVGVHGVRLVDVTSLFCTTARCALFVRSHDQAHLIYADSRHMNVAYALWIATAFATLLTPAL